MSINKTKILSYLPQIFAMLFLAGFVAYAWTEPSQPPPDGNVAAPVNVGSSDQTFSGSKTLWMKGDETGTMNLRGAFNVRGISQFLSDVFFDGRVGIGTTNPGAKLDVRSDDIKINSRRLSRFAADIQSSCVGAAATNCVEKCTSSGFDYCVNAYGSPSCSGLSAVCSSRGDACKCEKKPILTPIFEPVQKTCGAYPGPPDWGDFVQPGVVSAACDNYCVGLGLSKLRIYAWGFNESVSVGTNVYTGLDFATCAFSGEITSNYGDRSQFTCICN